MNGPSDFDARMRAALQRAAPDIDATDAARSTLRAGLARQRARRQRLVALSAAVVIVAGGVGAFVAVSEPGSSPTNLASAPPVTPGQRHAAAAESAPSGPSCPSLAVGAGSSACAGTVGGITPTAGSATGASTSSGGFAAATTTTAAVPSQSLNSAAAPSTTTVPTPVRVGQIFTISLPPVAPGHWLVPTELVVHGQQGSLYRLSVQQNSTTGSLVIRYKVRTAGAIDLQSSAVQACPTGQPATCTTVVKTWSLDLYASPRR